ncbi:MAG: peptide chain release factor N(5)-glutamine methyltransferase [Gammaproteobacteria bacterium]
MHTIQTVLTQIKQKFSGITDTPELDAELLLAHVLQCSRTVFHTWPEREISDTDYQTYLALCESRCDGVPVAYILGLQSFWKFELRVTPDVLIPRPETELIVELVLEEFADIKELSVVDLGTGSGAIALALASECPTWKITAVDNSMAALEVAIENAKRLDISKVHWERSDWYGALNNQKFNVIVSNPPYIAQDDAHLKALRHEPPTALVAAEEGLAALTEIISHAPEYLLENGYLFVEHGYQQADAVQELMHSAGFKDIQTYVDLASQPRVTRGIWRAI